MNERLMAELVERVVPVTERGRPDWDEVLGLATARQRLGVERELAQLDVSTSRPWWRPRAIPRRAEPMNSSRFRVRLALGSLIVLVAVGGVVQAITAQGTDPPQAASRERSPADAMPTLPAHVRVGAERAGLQLETSRKIAPNLYLVNKEDGQLCMVSTANGMSMGCAPTKNSFFGGNALHYCIDERRSPEAPRELTIYGVARPDVKAVRVMFPSGAVQAPTSADGGFSIKATHEQLEQGRPTALVGLGDNGRTIQLFRLPQG